MSIIVWLGLNDVVWKSAFPVSDLLIVKKFNHVAL